MENEKTQTAWLAGGCFWCLEAVFERVPGVVEVVSGYAGGSRDNPTYEEVCGGMTGHAETVKIRFDPELISYAELLDWFWRIHDPTTKDRQGADVGSQYRSVIFCADEGQKRIAEASMMEIAASFRDPLVTEIEPASKFWPAERHHQGYFRNHPEAAYCRIVIAPKVRKAGF